MFNKSKWFKVSDTAYLNVNEVASVYYSEDTTFKKHRVYFCYSCRTGELVSTRDTKEETDELIKRFYEFVK
jgi:hypothetical protein